MLDLEYALFSKGIVLISIVYHFLSLHQQYLSRHRDTPTYVAHECFFTFWMKFSKIEELNSIVQSYNQQACEGLTVIQSNNCASFLLCFPLTLLATAPSWWIQLKKIWLSGGNELHITWIQIPYPKIHVPLMLSRLILKAYFTFKILQVIQF